MKPLRFYELDPAVGLIEIPAPDVVAVDGWNAVYVECAACPVLVPFRSRSVRDRRSIHGRALCASCSDEVSAAEYDARTEMEASR